MLPFKEKRTRTDGRLSPDEKTIYFSSEGALWQAARASLDAPFEGDRKILDSAEESEMNPSVSADGLTLFYAIGTKAQIKVATRTQTADTFNPGKLLSELGADVTQVILAPKGDALYYAQKYDLMMARKAGDKFSNITALDTLNDKEAAYSYEMLSVVSPDEKTIYFASLRPNAAAHPDAKYNYDIYKAARSAISEPFGKAQYMPDLSSAAFNEYPNWMSPDRCRLYLHRVSDGPENGIMIAKRPPG
jgi:hypothetical protein